jgi:hypothetical protein
MHLADQPRKDAKELDQKVEVLLDPPEFPRRLLRDIFSLFLAPSR